MKTEKEIREQIRSLREDVARIDEADIEELGIIRAEIAALKWVLI